MTQQNFIRDIVFEQVYQKRVQSMANAHIAATGTSIFNEGISFGINLILNMLKDGVVLTEKSIADEIQKRMIESSKDVVPTEQNKQVVSPEKKPFKLQRIK